jgi:hypothetical protein
MTLSQQTRISVSARTVEKEIGLFSRSIFPLAAIAVNAARNST